MQGKVRMSVLFALRGCPKTPSRIADETGEHLSHISRALREMKEKGLVECMTPGRSKNRIYQITEKGVIVLEELSKNNR